MASRIAVMDGGRVQQIAPPAELYEFPASRFVADFIGSVNLIEGKVRSTVDGTLTLDCAGFELPVVIVQPASLEAGATAWVALRPEKIDISKEPSRAATCNAVSGTVEEITYLGETSVYHVRVDPDLPMVKVSSANLDRVTRRAFTWEDRVHLSWTRSCGVVLDR